MSRSVVTLLIALLVILVAGIFEVVYVNQEYAKVEQQCKVLLDKAKDKTLTTNEFDDFYKNWHDLREKSELFLPHVDVYEINLRISESKALLDNGDFEMVYAQLEIAHNLLQYIPNMMIPSLKHII